MYACIQIQSQKFQAYDYHYKILDKILHIHTPPYMYINIHKKLHPYTYVHTYTYAHAHTYTYIHTNYIADISS